MTQYRVAYKPRPRQYGTAIGGGNRPVKAWKYTPWTNNKEQVERMYFSFTLCHSHFARIEECVAHEAAA